MSRDPFLVAKEAVSARDAARYLGMEFDRYGRTLCPYHNDHRPSLSFRKGRFHCFACGADGDCIDLTRKVSGGTYWDALRLLNNAFHLGLALDGDPTPEQREAAKKAKEVRDAKKRFDAWRRQALDDITAALCIANHVDWTNLTDRESVAVREQARLEYWSDILLHGSNEEQFQLFTNRKRVKTLTRIILQTT